MTVLSLDQSAWRRALRELDDDHRHWFQLVVTTTAEALSEGRSCIVTTNNLKFLTVAGGLLNIWVRALR